MFFIIRKEKLILFSLILLFVSIIATYAWAKHPKMDQWTETHQVISQYDTTDKVVALTFDDGPNPEATPQILEALRRYNAHATFFVLGSKLESYPLLAKQMAQDGHEIGNHSYEHTDFNQLSHDEMVEDIVKTNHTIYDLSGKTCTWLRPPGGYLSIDLVEQIAPSLNMKIGYWSYIQDSKDWQTGRSAQQIADYILQHIAPGQIILLHDGCSNSPQTAQAVEIILRALDQEGYEFLSLSEMEARYGQTR